MFKERFAKTIAEYERFWERTNTDRPILNGTYRLPDVEPFRAPTSPYERWMDLDYKHAEFRHRFLKELGYVAEGVPMCFTNYGPGCFAACIGGEYELRPDTIWFDKKQLIEDFENPPEIRFDPESEIWQSVVAEQARYAADPDLHFSITDIGGVIDIIASLRGTENLLYDLYDYPDEFKEMILRVRTEWKKAFDQQLETVRRAGQPFNHWMNVPSAKPWYPIQCDFSYMISPKQFEEFVLPDVIDLAQYMDRSIYHLDGPGEIPHLDMLLDIPELTGIQWVAGDGNAPLTDECWFDLYRRIQDKNKNIILIGGIGEHDMAGAERLIKSIDPKGVYISFDASSREKAEEMVEAVTEWSR